MKTSVLVWEHAEENDYVIVSKDNDFRQRSFLYGPPPKVISVSVGNAGTDEIAELLRQNRNQIQTFVDDPSQGLLLL